MSEIKQNDAQIQYTMYTTDDEYSSVDCYDEHKQSIADAIEANVNYRKYYNDSDIIWFDLDYDNITVECVFWTRIYQYGLSRLAVGIDKGEKTQVYVELFLRDENLPPAGHFKYYVDDDVWLIDDHYSVNTCTDDKVLARFLVYIAGIVNPNSMLTMNNVMDGRLNESADNMSYTMTTDDEYTSDDYYEELKQTVAAAIEANIDYTTYNEDSNYIRFGLDYDNVTVDCSYAMNGQSIRVRHYKLIQLLVSKYKDCEENTIDVYVGLLLREPTGNRNSEMFRYFIDEDVWTCWDKPIIAYTADKELAKFLVYIAKITNPNSMLTVDNVLQGRLNESVNDGISYAMATEEDNLENTKLEELEDIIDRLYGCLPYKEVVDAPGYKTGKRFLIGKEVTFRYIDGKPYKLHSVDAVLSNFVAIGMEQEIKIYIMFCCTMNNTKETLYYDFKDDVWKSMNWGGFTPHIRSMVFAQICYDVTCAVNPYTMLTIKELMNVNTPTQANESLDYAMTTDADDSDESSIDNAYECAIDSLENLLAYDNIEQDIVYTHSRTRFNLSENCFPSGFDLKDVTVKYVDVMQSVDYFKQPIVYVHIPIDPYRPYAIDTSYMNYTFFGTGDEHRWKIDGIYRISDYYNFSSQLAEFFVKVAECVEPDTNVTMEDFIKQRKPVKYTGDDDDIMVENTIDYRMTTDEDDETDCLRELYATTFDNLENILNYDNITILGDIDSPRPCAYFHFDDLKVRFQHEEYNVDKIGLILTADGYIYISVRLDNGSYTETKLTYWSENGYNKDNSDKWFYNESVDVALLDVSRELAELLVKLAMAVNPNTMLSVKSLISESNNTQSMDYAMITDDGELTPEELKYELYQDIVNQFVCLLPFDEDDIMKRTTRFYFVDCECIYNDAECSLRRFTVCYDNDQNNILASIQLVRKDSNYPNVMDYSMTYDGDKDVWTDDYDKEIDITLIDNRLANFICHISNIMNPNTRYYIGKNKPVNLTTETVDYAMVTDEEEDIDYYEIISDKLENILPYDRITYMDWNAPVTCFLFDDYECILNYHQYYLVRILIITNNDGTISISVHIRDAKTQTPTFINYDPMANDEWIIDSIPYANINTKFPSEKFATLLYDIVFAVNRNTNLTVKSIMDPFVKEDLNYSMVTNAEETQEVSIYDVTDKLENILPYDRIENQDGVEPYVDFIFSGYDYMIDNKLYSLKTVTVMKRENDELIIYVDLEYNNESIEVYYQPDWDDKWFYEGIPSNNINEHNPDEKFATLLYNIASTINYNTTLTIENIIHSSVKESTDYLITNREDNSDLEPDPFDAAMDAIEAILPYKDIEVTASSASGRRCADFDLGNVYKCSYGSERYKVNIVRVLWANDRVEVDVYLKATRGDYSAMMYYCPEDDIWKNMYPNINVNEYYMDKVLGEFLLEIAKAVNPATTLCLNDILYKDTSDQVMEELEYSMLTDEDDDYEIQMQLYNSVFEAISQHLPYVNMEVEDGDKESLSRAYFFTEDNMKFNYKGEELTVRYIFIVNKPKFIEVGSNISVNVMLDAKNTTVTRFTYYVNLDNMWEDYYSTEPLNNIQNLDPKLGKFLYNIARVVNPNTKMTLKSIINQYVTNPDNIEHVNEYRIRTDEDENYWRTIAEIVEEEFQNAMDALENILPYSSIETDTDEIHYIIDDFVCRYKDTEYVIKEVVLKNYQSSVGVMVESYNKNNGKKQKIYMNAAETRWTESYTFREVGDFHPDLKMARFLYNISFALNPDTEVSIETIMDSNYKDPLDESIDYSMITNDTQPSEEEMLEERFQEVRDILENILPYESIDDSGRVYFYINDDYVCRYKDKDYVIYYVSVFKAQSDVGINVVMHVKKDIITDVIYYIPSSDQWRNTSPIRNISKYQPDEKLAQFLYNISRSVNPNTELTVDLIMGRVPEALDYSMLVPEDGESTDLLDEEYCYAVDGLESILPYDEAHRDYGYSSFTFYNRRCGYYSRECLITDVVVTKDEDEGVNIRVDLTLSDEEGSTFSFYYNVDRNTWIDELNQEFGKHNPDERLIDFLNMIAQTVNPNFGC